MLAEIRPAFLNSYICVNQNCTDYNAITNVFIDEFASKTRKYLNMGKVELSPITSSTFK